jgi:hypothetical protein
MEENIQLQVKPCSKITANVLFQCPLDVHIDFAIDIMKACCVLHNSVHTRDDITYEDTLTLFSITRDVNKKYKTILWRFLYTVFCWGRRRSIAKQIHYVNSLRLESHVAYIYMYK